MDLKKAIILEDSAFYKRGQVLEVKETDDGILTEDGSLVAAGKFIILNERLSQDDEKKVRELIRSALKQLFWSLYTKQGIILN